MEFMGYKRADGKVGVRNHVIVVPGVICAAVAAKKIADKTGAVFVGNPNGCGQSPEDTATTLEIITGLIANPNVFGALIVGLGCEALQEERYRSALAKLTDKPIEYVKIQDRGLAETVKRGAALTEELLKKSSSVKREPCSVSELILGLECGGSDPTSGLCSNVVLGKVTDMIIDMGGSAALTETPEAVGAEHILKRRGATPEIGQKIYDSVKAFEQMFLDRGMNVREGNPSPGNIAGGITTLEEKSLGCIHKAGSRPFTGFYRYGEQITGKGLCFIDTTAFDVASVTAKAAAGSQITVFTTGRGNPVGNPVCPVIKMTANRDTAERLADIIDFDSSGAIAGEVTQEQLADELLAYIIRVCEGELTKAEINGSAEILINQQMSYC